MALVAIKHACPSKVVASRSTGGKLVMFLPANTSNYSGLRYSGYLAPFKEKLIRVYFFSQQWISRAWRCVKGICRVWGLVLGGGVQPGPYRVFGLLGVGRGKAVPF